MLTLTDITNAVNMVAAEYSIKRVMLFGSYAEGNNTSESDVDNINLNAQNALQTVFYVNKCKQRHSRSGKLHKYIKLKGV